MTPRAQKLPKILFEIGKAIGQGSDLGTLLANISELATELVDGDACSVMLLDAKRERLLAKAAYGLRVANLRRVSFGIGEGVAGWVASTGQPALIDDVNTDERFVQKTNPSTAIRAMACVPLSVRNVPIGVLTATSGEPAKFGQGELELLQFVASTISLDIENARLRKVSVTDPLTGAFNREFLQERLPVEMERGAPLSIAMVDVDHFKRVNDKHGHDVGDRVLVVVAERLRAAIRGDDMLVRYGGEEFLVLLPDTPLAQAVDIAERMRQKMQANPVHAGGIDVEIRISIGVAQFKGENESLDNFVRRADTALYSAKGRGRNRVEAAS